MNVRDTIIAVLTAVSAAAAFAGAWLTWALGVALLVLAAYVTMVALLMAFSATDETVVVEAEDDEPLLGEAPEKATVTLRNPFANRSAS